MRLTCLLFLFSAAAFSQPFSFGVKAGLPLTDFVDAVNTQNFTSSAYTNRYIVGPTAELRLPFGLGVEFDALYRHFGYSVTGIIAGPTSTIVSSSTTGSAWEFPLLAKYRFPGKIVRPFVSAGVAWDRLSGLSQSVHNAVSTGSVPELSNNTTTGFVMGGGIEVKALLIRLSPEIRYTHWGSAHFNDPAGLISSKQNQAEFLVGITF
jgi:opacity protein-like surface antigen